MTRSFSGVRVLHPATCDAATRDGFQRLVQRGFPFARDLERRVAEAKWIALAFAPDGTPVAVAALKRPDVTRRRAIFEQADAPLDPDEWTLDLGWVFVERPHRGRGAGRALCEALLAHEPAAPVFSTTATDNAPMTSILRTLGFVPLGRPYARRDAQLVLFVRPDPLAERPAGNP